MASMEAARQIKIMQEDEFSRQERDGTASPLPSPPQSPSPLQQVSFEPSVSSFSSSAATGDSITSPICSMGSSSDIV
jgi:hypothetical protein